MSRPKNCERLFSPSRLWGEQQSKSTVQMPLPLEAEMFRGIKYAAVPLAFAFGCAMTVRAQETQSPESAKTSSTASSAQDNALMYSYEKSPERYYRLEFRVLELSAEGKVVNSRTYNEVVASGSKSSAPSLIRSRDRGLARVSSSGSEANSAPAKGQDQYFHIGTDIDAYKVAALDKTLRLHVNADIESQSVVSPAAADRPTDRATRWDSNVIVPIGRPTVIFSSDNNSDGGKMELELTAVPLDQSRGVLSEKARLAPGFAWAGEGA